MARYCSHTIILPDENHLDNFVVEVNGNSVSYYPFTGEVHSTIYVDTPILISHRADLDGKTISLDLLAWALHDSTSGDVMLYAYRLSPCTSCMGNRFTMTRL
jgi:hypothetical protein